MSRLPDLDLDDLTDEQRALYAGLQNRPEIQAHGLVGPFATWMQAPAIGAPLAELGRNLRFAASLPANVTEVAICTTGAFFRSSFELAAHLPLARKAGVDAAALGRLCAGDEPRFEGDEAAAHAVATELLRDHAIADATFTDASERFGPRGVTELITTVGFYALNAFLLSGFQIPLAPGMDDPLAT